MLLNFSKIINLCRYFEILNERFNCYMLFLQEINLRVKSNEVIFELKSNIKY